MNNIFSLQDEQKILNIFIELISVRDNEAIDEMEYYLDQKILQLFFGIYQLNHFNTDYKGPSSKDIIEIISNIYELRTNNKRDDENINTYLAAFLSLLIIFVSAKEFNELNPDFLYGLEQIVNIQLYLYNTENEDGNKTEYEDLSSVEKLYTDNLMNRIREIEAINTDNQDDKSIEILRILIEALPDGIDRGLGFVDTTIKDYLDNLLHDYGKEFFIKIDIEPENEEKQKAILSFLDNIVENIVINKD